VADATRFFKPEAWELLAGGAASLSERHHRSHAERGPAQTRNIAASTTRQPRHRGASCRLRALTQLEKHLHTNVNENLALEVCFVQAFG